MVIMKVGDEVICINNKWRWVLSDVTYPELHQELTIREIHTYPSGSVGLVFEEITNGIKPTSIGLIEWDFDIVKFRLKEDHNFTNKLTAQLAREAMKEVKEYQPLKIEIPIEVIQ